jgi:ABC-type nitrate/sulfonate/bicarbonate transport system substrate-binding protein
MMTARAGRAAADRRGSGDGRRRRLRTWSLAAGLTVLVLAGALFVAAGGSQAAGPAMTLRLSASTPFLWPQIPVANAAGLWAKHGVTVDYSEFATGRETMQMLVGGRADVAATSPTPLVMGAFAGQPLRAFAVVARWSRWRVLARADRGITEPAHLKGKKIGISIGTSSELAFDHFLGLNGLSRANVEIVNLGPPDMIPALESGGVDAINTWQPIVYEAESRLAARVRPLPYSYTNNYLLLTTTEVAGKNADLLRRVLAVMADADRFIGENRERAIEVTAKASGMKVEAIKAIWSELEVGTSAPDARVMGEMEMFAAFAVRAKLVREGTKAPDLKSLLLGL